MSLQKSSVIGTCLVILSACASSPRGNTAVAASDEKPTVEAPRANQRQANPSQTTVHADYQPHAIASGACPSKQMTCYPGCATVKDLYLCGEALLVAAGSLAAAVALLAKEEGLTLADFCLRYETLCASKADTKAGKAKAAPKPLVLRRDTPCKLIEREKDVSTLPEVYLCVYRCEGVAEQIVIELGPGIERCPGEAKRIATWEQLGGLYRRSP